MQYVFRPSAEVFGLDAVTQLVPKTIDLVFQIAGDVAIVVLQIPDAQRAVEASNVGLFTSAAVFDMYARLWSGGFL